MICARAHNAIELTVKRLFEHHPDNLLFVLGTLPGGGAGLTVQQFSRLFRDFARSWRLSGCRPSCGLRVWERHQSGGWHVHFLIPVAAFSDVDHLTRFWVAAGGGRVFFKPVRDGSGAQLCNYLANELSKFRQRDMSDQDRRVRTWAAWGECAVASGSVIFESPVGALLGLWGPLKPGRRYMLLCRLRRLDRRGLLPPPGATPLRQWRIITGHRVMAPCKAKLSCRIGGQPMRITASCVYIGQSVESYISRSFDKASGKVTEIPRNSLKISLETEDGDVFFGKMRLPPDADPAKVAPLAKKYTPVYVEIVQFKAWAKDDVDIMIASVKPRAEK